MVEKGTGETKYYTPQELSDRWQISITTTYKWLRDLPRLRVQRKLLVPADALYEWEARHLQTQSSEDYGQDTSNKVKTLDISDRKITTPEITKVGGQHRDVDYRKAAGSEGSHDNR